MAEKDYAWPGEARLALSLVVNVEEGAEMLMADGAKMSEPVDELQAAPPAGVRNFGNESNYQYGIKAGAPRVLRLLDEYGVTATFTACAVALEKAPDLAQAIARGGHEACSHGFRWQPQHNMNEEKERAFIQKAVASIEKTTGTRPYGWLSRYLHTAETRRLLAEEGFVYHMDDYSDDKPYWDVAGGKPIVVLPYAIDSNDMKFWLDPSFTPQNWLDYAKDTFDVLYEEGAYEPRMMSLGTHLRIIGRPGRIWALEEFLAYVTEKKDVWITTRLQIAKHFARVVKAPG
jgi:peptidoglycan/xylan/chitin deacetylase (PgdA/CDA1 family)